MLLAGLVAVALGSCGAPIPTEYTVGRTSEASCGDVDRFYAANPDVRIWVDHGRLTRKGAALASAFAAVGGSAPARSERAMADAFVQYAAGLSAAPASASVRYVDDVLRPEPPCPSKLLEQADALPRLEPLLDRLRAPNLVARRLQGALDGASDPETRAKLSADLALARSFGSFERAILVDIGAARLWALERGGLADTMRVVVGKAGSDTPAMAALLRFAKLNPYWDVPPDLVARNIAPQAAAGGLDYLEQRDYEVVDAYGPAPRRLDAAAVDWKAVQTGALSIGVRQRPGPTNTMGRVLFMFPNQWGIYLHDTPQRAVFAREDRRISNGCVRLERAADLYRWAFGQELPDPQAVGPDQRVDVPRPMPVFLVNFSAEGSAALAQLGGLRTA